MTLKLDLIGTITETVETVSVGEWIAVYAFYVITQGGLVRARVYLGGVVKVTLDIVTSLVPSDFSTADSVKIGGAFSGNIKRIQVYSPAAVGFASGASKKIV